MFDFPKWKLGLVVVLVLLAAVYSLPNLFPSQPAIQISANRGSTIDEALQGRVEDILQDKQIPFLAVERTDTSLLVRFGDPDEQLKGADVLHDELQDKYTVALNLASTVPGWLTAIGARPMTLGLDLQGGVHFLMEVDEQAARDKLVERYVSELYQLLRADKIAYRSVAATVGGLSIQLSTVDDRVKAQATIAAKSPDLLLDEPDPASTSLFARIRPEKLIEAQTHTITQNITTLRNRVNELGVAEPIIQQQGKMRIVVQLPGVQDTALAKRILGATATLEYRAVNDTANAVEAQTGGKIPPDSKLYFDKEGRPYLLKKEVIATGDQLIDATSGFDQQSGTPSVSVRLDSSGGKRMLDFTSENVGRPMAVVYIERVPETRTIDGKEVRSFKETQTVISVASIRGVFGPTFQTTGLESSTYARDLALLLRAGSLAVPVDIIEERIIGPSLGRENIRAGVEAMVIGTAFIIVFVMFYYKLVGVVTVLGLGINLLLLVAILSVLGATLTMPGIAGIVLTLGMAVDANVLIAERIREEIRAGNSPLTALRAGYEKAWGTILDANLTHVFASLAMFAFGSGPIRGFAITMFAGILTSMFSAVTVTQLIMALIYGRQRKVQAISV
ncbi:MAG: protein translocase subunit SecD [Xanthomonadales bacterium]|nr:Protein translocase subunit SecD [Xanthomonadales bacterium]MCC6594216.1 protein translocase subunit SecD [Xanthomonadales bacterium]MCE7930617.1 protein translocase subunit SecD [Xanthomonadales bacterium PRO6]